MARTAASNRQRTAGKKDVTMQNSVRPENLPVKWQEGDAA
jgi:hypothetical protein